MNLTFLKDQLSSSHPHLRNAMGNSEESRLFFGNLHSPDDKRKVSSVITSKLLPSKLASHQIAGAVGWTVDGVPINRRSVIGEPIHRTQWDSSLFTCLGRSDEFCSSDIEVCLLGSVAPCVLFASNVERLSSTPGSFTTHCLPYSGLYLIGNSFLGGNFLAPWFSYFNRTSIRRRFNLEGNCEALLKSCGLCGSLLEDEDQIEQCERICDFGVHVFCHSCALCQEGREIRRRLPHPGFATQPVLFMIPPGEQTMDRQI